MFLNIVPSVDENDLAHPRLGDSLKAGAGLRENFIADMNSLQRRLLLRRQCGLGEAGQRGLSRKKTFYVFQSQKLKCELTSGFSSSCSTKVPRASMGQSAHVNGSLVSALHCPKNTAGTRTVRATLEHQTTDRGFDAIAQPELSEDFFHMPFNSGRTNA